MAATRQCTNSYGLTTKIHAPEPQDPVSLTKKLATSPEGSFRKPQVPQGPRHGEQGHVVHPVQVEKGLQPLR